VLEKQIHDSITTENSVLGSLQFRDALIATDLKTVADAGTTNALVFKNQLLADRIALRVEIQDVEFRINDLRQFEKDQF
jgi:hypothetical protein